MHRPFWGQAQSKVARGVLGGGAGELPAPLKGTSSRPPAPAGQRQAQSVTRVNSVTAGPVLMDWILTHPLVLSLSRLLGRHLGLGHPRLSPQQ